MEIRPDFYDYFYCLAGECRHSCCREGWEIDVDDGTAALYAALDTPLGAELRSALTVSPDGSRSLRLTSEGVCPFFRPDGLCRVVAELGEDALCDICALHPRFFEDVGDHALAGVGLCCEAAAALLLEGKGSLTFLAGEDEPLTLSSLLSLLGQQAPEEALAFSPNVEKDYYQSIFRRYARCEAIDDGWTADLTALAADPEGAVQTAEVYIKSYDRTVFDRIFQYILYRQLELVEAHGLPALLRYARESTDFILLWAAVTGDLPECLRRWSAEMEYSTENVELLLDS